MIRLVPRVLAAAAATLLPFAVAPIGAQQPARSAARPTLVVFFTIDQMIPDYFARYGREFTAGMKRLQSGGVLYTNGYQDHATTETAPGHAATLSGRFPMHTGIVRNNAGVNDREHALLGSGGSGASPFRFIGSTLTDWISAVDPASRTLSVSRKDRGAILPVGRSRQSVFWYANDGRFTTSRWYADTLPTWLVRFNARRLPHRLAGSAWTLLRAPSQYAERDSVPVESGGRDFTFPHLLPSDTVQAVRELPDDPRMDQITLQAAMAGLDAMALGKGPSTDVLAISLSTTDAVGHRYGPASREIHDHLLRLDRYMGEFLDSLYKVRDSSRIIIALTADHGVQPFPELHFAKQPQATLRVNAQPVLTQAMRALAARGVDTARALDFEYGMLFADSMVFRRAGVPLDSVLDAMAAAFRRVPGVARVDLRRDLARADTVRDAVARRWIHALPASLPVMLLVSPKPYVYWQGVNYATHGSPNDADARVPVLFYGPGFARGVTRTRSVRVVDIAPTLARRIGVSPTETLDGTVLLDAFRR
ncbi:MAG TPA: alkaline phosphatase family protein [Gemmatimonadaceae bacterium]|nr:alkaline phosphatase family protein [Gemmatimonadaceae bacterium]